MYISEGVTEIGTGVLKYHRICWSLALKRSAHPFFCVLEQKSMRMHLLSSEWDAGQL